MPRSTIPKLLVGSAVVLMLSSCAELRQKLRDDQLARLKFEEAEMQRTLQSVQEVVTRPQHVALFIGLPAIDRTLAHLDGAKFLLEDPNSPPSKKPRAWLTVNRLRMAGRNGVPIARLEGSVVRGWARVDVVGEALISVEMDPVEIGEAHLRVRLRSLRPTVHLGPLALPVWGLFRDVIEMGLSQQLPTLDPKLDELPIQLTKAQGFKQDAMSKTYESGQNFVNASYRIDTPAIDFKAAQLIQAFVLDDGLYLYVRYQP